MGGYGNGREQPQELRRKGEAAQHVVGGGGLWAVPDTQGRARVSADPKEKGNKNGKCSLGEDCWKGPSHRDRVTQRLVTD